MRFSASIRGSATQSGVGIAVGGGDLAMLSMLSPAIRLLLLIPRPPNLAACFAVIPLVLVVVAFVLAVVVAAAVDSLPARRPFSSLACSEKAPEHAVPHPRRVHRVKGGRRVHGRVRAAGDRHGSERAVTIHREGVDVVG